MRVGRRTPAVDGVRRRPLTCSGRGVVHAIQGAGAAAPRSNPIQPVRAPEPDTGANALEAR